MAERDAQGRFLPVHRHAFQLIDGSFLPRKDGDAYGRGRRNFTSIWLVCGCGAWRKTRLQDDTHSPTRTVHVGTWEPEEKQG